MTKKEIYDELVRVRMELLLHKRDQEKCEKLEEEHQRLKRELTNLLIKEEQQKQESNHNNIK